MPRVRSVLLGAHAAALDAGDLPKRIEDQYRERIGELPPPLPHQDLLLRGLAVRLTDGYRAAAPALKEALRRYRAQPQDLDWLSVSYKLVAIDL